MRRVATASAWPVGKGVVGASAAAQSRATSGVAIVRPAIQGLRSVSGVPPGAGSWLPRP